MIDFTFYKYNVKWYNDHDHKVEDLCGITIGGSYSDAFSRVLDYYGGEGEVEGIYIEAWDVTNCFELRPEILRFVEFDDLDPAPAATAKSLDVNLDFVTPDASKIADNVAIKDETPLTGVVGPNDKVCGDFPAKAYVEQLPDICYYGTSIDSIVKTEWFEKTANQYGLGNIIFEEDE